MSLSEISIRRPVFAWMLMFGLIVFGAISFQRMGISQMPDVNFPRGDRGIVHLPALIAHAFGVSTSEARRSLTQGGVRVDGDPLDAEALEVPLGLVDGRVLQLGKRRFARVHLV